MPSKLQSGWLFLISFICFILGICLINFETALTTTIPLENSDASIYVYRGLFKTTLASDHNGRWMEIEMDNEDKDANGDKLDPFCGSPDAISPFQTYFPVLRTDPDTGVMLNYSSGVCCSENTLFKASRADNLHSWCHVRDDVSFQRLIGVSLMSATFFGLFISMLCCRSCISPSAALTSSFLLLLVGCVLHLSASIMMASWVRKVFNTYEAEQLATYTIDARDSLYYVIGSVALLVSLFGFARAIYVNKDCCCRREQAQQDDHDPETVAVQLVPAKYSGLYQPGMSQA
eukprot:m.5236 g.5236  ORF g.5236 m.5236 type:complete len:289 (-) comp7520_c0_seq1:95-961(-)